jgi:hypothetical protein
MNPTRLASKTANLLVIPFLVACAIGVSGFGAISQPAAVQAAPIAVAVQAAPIAVAVAAPAATGGFIDHSVLLNAPYELPAPNLQGLSVAAYDD